MKRLFVALLAGVVGCSSLMPMNYGFPPPKAVGPSASYSFDVARCETLDNRQTVSGAFAVSASFLGSAAGVTAIVTNNQTADIALAITSVAMAAIGLGAAYVRDSSTKAFIREGCWK